MITNILVRHKVKDYTIWKKVYDMHLPKRIEAGLTERNLFRGDTDPNEIVILFEAKDLVLAKKFIESVDLREVMEKAGVIGEPDILVLHEERTAYAKASGF
jgi:hypothetical protein